MEKPKERPVRCAPAHLPVREAFNRSVIVFVTICADKHRSLFARDDVHTLIVDAWRKADLWRVGKYVVMPDHIHFFCAPAVHDYPPLKKWIQFWKAMVTRNWSQRDDIPIWQKSFWDTQLRKGERYHEKWEYVQQNPVRKGLVENPDMWPYMGELNVLEWHD